MKRMPVVDGQEVLKDNLEWIQCAKEEAIVERITDCFTDGIVGQAAGTPFNITDNGDGTFTVGTGVGFYDGERIEISDATVTYDASAPYDTTADGIGGTVLTPKSTGSANIPIDDGALKYIGISALLYCDNENIDGSLKNYSLHPYTKKRIFYTWKDGYTLEVVDNRSLLSAGALYLGSVARSGLVITPDLSDRQSFSIRSEVNLLGAGTVVDGAITEPKIANGAVTENKIATNAVTELKIADLSVTEPKLASNAVIERVICNNAVTTNKIADCNVTTSKINLQAVTCAQIAACTIYNCNLQTNAVDSRVLCDLSVTTNKICAANVTYAKMADNSICTNNICTGAVTGVKIAATTVAAGNICNGTITTTQLSATAGIVGGQIANTTVAGGNICNTTIAGSNICAGTITCDKIAASGVCNCNIAAGAVTCDKLSGPICGCTTAVNGKAIVGCYDSTAGCGVIGCSTGGHGVVGHAVGSGGSGVAGFSINSRGLYGSSDNDVGVRGEGATYDFYAGGAGCNYGPFTGVHDGIYSGGKLAEGDIVIDCGNCYTRTKGIASTLSVYGRTCIACDKRVSGVSGVPTKNKVKTDHWIYTELGIKDPKNWIGMFSLGEGLVKICEDGGNLEVGDLVTTSTKAGFAMRQNTGSGNRDNVVRNYTLGKAREDVDWSKVSVDPATGFRWKLVAVYYYAG